MASKLAGKVLGEGQATTDLMGHLLTAGLSSGAVMAVLPCSSISLAAHLPPDLMDQVKRRCTGHGTGR